MDFYVRVFVRVYSGAQLSKTAASRLATVYQSLGCSSFFLQRVGECTKREKSIKYTASRG